MRPDRRILTLFLLTVLPAVHLGCQTNPATGRKQLLFGNSGRDTAPDFITLFGGRHPDDQLQDYIQKLGAKVARQSGASKQVDFILLASDVPNAFVDADGKVYITAGLMMRLDQERQLAAALGHETGHIAKDHYRKKARRKDEYQADALAARYLAEAGYHPLGVIELLEVLQHYYLCRDDTGFEDSDRNHPSTGERMAHIREALKEDWAQTVMGPPADAVGRFDEMKRRLVYGASSALFAAQPTQP